MVLRSDPDNKSNVGYVSRSGVSSVPGIVILVPNIADWFSEGQYLLDVMTPDLHRIAGYLNLRK